ncbi:MAG: helix-turn-helix domain-containing protein [Caldilineaceae bacterium]
MNDFLTPPEIAKLLRVSSSTVQRLIDKGALRGTRLSEKSWRRVERQQLIDYARARQISLDWSLLGKDE